MTAASAVLDVARAELGTAESPAGSNRVKYNTWYYGRAVTGSAYPWCAVFVSWVAAQAGALAAAIIPKHAYTPTGAAWFKARGQWSRTPRVGSIVYYQWPGMNRISHVGIVEAVHADGSWTAIEGNTDGAGSRTGGRVMRQRRSSLGALGGFGHPAYAGASTPAPTPPAQTRDRDVVRATQRAVNFPAPEVDGAWGPNTEHRINLVRMAINGQFLPDGIDDAQICVGATPDGAWGPASRRALTATIKKLQTAWGVTADGVWGAQTEAAWAAARAANFRG